MPASASASWKTPRVLDVSKIEGWRLKKDGTKLWANVVISAVRDPQNGKLLGFSKVTRDLTERKKAENKFRGLLEAAPDAMVIFDKDGHIVLVNAQTERLFGYSRDELIGQSREILVAERFRGDIPEARDAYFASPEVKRAGLGRELFGVRKDGSEFPIEASLGPLETEDGLLISRRHP